MVTFEDLEEARKSTRKKSLKFKIPSFIGSIIVFIFLALKNLHSGSEDIEKAMLFLPISMASMIPMLIGYTLVTVVFAKEDEQKYKKMYKEYFIEPTLKTIFESVEYKPEKGLSRNQVLWPGLLKEGNSFSSEDYFKATYKGIDIEGSDLLIQYRSDDATSTYFSGLWTIFHLKTPLSNFQIIRKDFSGGAQNVPGSVVRDLEWVDENVPEEELFDKYWPEEEMRAKKVKESSPPFVKCKTENDIFNKHYKVFSQNEAEAQSFLAQDITDKFNALAESIPSAFMVGSVEGKIYIAIKCSNLFDPNNNKPINEESERERIKNIIQATTSIYNALSIQ